MNRSDPICVTSTKVAKASTQTVTVANIFAKKSLPIYMSLRELKTCWELNLKSSWELGKVSRELNTFESFKKVARN